MGFFDFMTEEIAIDLGTANTLIIHLDKVVVDSPSIVARDRVSGKIIAVGREASMMQGKTHENIKKTEKKSKNSPRKKKKKRYERPKSRQKTDLTERTTTRNKHPS